MVIPRSIRLPTTALVIAVASGIGNSSQAQDPTDRTTLRLPAPPSLSVASRGSLAAPSVSIGVPTGFGASFGDIFAGVGFQSRTRFADRVDGGAVVGVGLGDPRRYLGLEIAASTFGTFRSCCRGGLSAKVHRMLPGATSVAVGWESFAGWGHLARTNDEIASSDIGFTDGGSSVYAALTRVFPLREDADQRFGTLTATIGAGTGRFRRESDILEDRGQRVNPFASAALRIAEPVSLITSWTGQDLNAGVSVVPLRGGPLVLTLGAADLTTRPRVLIGAGFGFAYPY